MKNFSKIITITIGVFLMSLMLLFLGAKIYLKANKKELIVKAVKYIETNYHSIVTIEDLDVSFFQHFPNLSLEIKKHRC